MLIGRPKMPLPPLSDAVPHIAKPPARFRTLGRYFVNRVRAYDSTQLYAYRSTPRDWLIPVYACTLTQCHAYKGALV